MTKSIDVIHVNLKVSEERNPDIDFLYPPKMENRVKCSGTMIG